MPRSGMTNLLLELRARCDAGTADYASGGVTHWTDDQLQQVLDRHRVDVPRELMVRAPEYTGGSAVYFNYGWRCAWAEEAASGTTIWRVEDSAGSIAGTALYTPEYAAQTLRFGANTGGVAYYLTYRTYDLDRAAADVWEQKAANVAGRFDIKTDNHDLKRSQLRQSYLDMAASFRRRAGAKASTWVRGDLSGEPRYEGPFKPVDHEVW